MRSACGVGHYGTGVNANYAVCKERGEEQRGGGHQTLDRELCMPI